MGQESFIRRMNGRPAFAAEAGITQDFRLTFGTFHAYPPRDIIGIKLSIHERKSKV